MKQEIKICLPGYKLAYSILFMVLLSLVRGISSFDEIGVTIEPYLAILTVVFCGDTYMCEWYAKRGEVFSLLPFRSRIKAVYRRLAIQIGYLWLAGAIGYFLFFWQHPVNYSGVSLGQAYGWFLFAILGNILFWSLFSMTVSNLFRNQFAGMGSSIVLWLMLYSTWGDRYLGDYNIFSYVFREVSGGTEWIYGNAAAILLSMLMLAAVPYIMKKRG